MCNYLIKFYQQMYKVIYLIIPSFIVIKDSTKIKFLKIRAIFNYNEYFLMITLFLIKIIS
jgi:hypothetical protein